MGGLVQVPRRPWPPARLVAAPAGPRRAARRRREMGADLPGAGVRVLVCQRTCASCHGEAPAQASGLKRRSKPANNNHSATSGVLVSAAEWMATSATHLAEAWRGSPAELLLEEAGAAGCVLVFRGASAVLQLEEARFRGASALARPGSGVYSSGAVLAVRDCRRARACSLYSSERDSE
jgi:hypothetical protein